MKTYTTSTTAPKASPKKSNTTKVRHNSEMLSRLEGLDARLRKYAKRHASAMVSADDLYQIATEEILTHCSPTDNDTYMLRLADWRMKNTVSRELTYSVRVSEHEIEPEDDEVAFVVSNPNPPEAAVEAKELNKAIMSTLAGMSDMQQQIIALLAEGSSNREIGRILGMSHPSVKKHVDAIRESFKNAGLTPTFSFA